MFFVTAAASAASAASAVSAAATDSLIKSTTIPSSSSVMGDLVHDYPSVALTVLLSFIVHWFLFYFLPIPSSMLPTPSSSSSSTHSSHHPLDPFMIRSYLMSTFHSAIVCAYILLWFVFFDSDLTDVRRGVGGGMRGTGDEYQIYLVAFSFGYFLYDTTCMMLYPSVANFASYLHHIVIGSAFVIGLSCHVCLPFHFMLLLEELSTPSLNLKSLWKHRPEASLLHSKLFVLFFFLSRMIYGMVVFFSGLLTCPSFWTGDSTEIERWCLVFQLSLSSTSRVLNVYWMGLIIKKTIAALKGIKEEEGKGGKKRRKSIQEQVDEALPSLASTAKPEEEDIVSPIESTNSSSRNGNGSEVGNGAAIELIKRKSGAARSRRAE